jgi:hypothetical protein
MSRNKQPPTIQYIDIHRNPNVLLIVRSLLNPRVGIPGSEMEKVKAKSA